VPNVYVERSELTYICINTFLNIVAVSRQIDGVFIRIHSEYKENRIFYGSERHGRLLVDWPVTVQNETDDDVPVIIFYLRAAVAFHGNNKPAHGTWHNSKISRRT